MYLPVTLNIRKMWQHYNSVVNPEKRVTQNFFRNTFNTKFNTGFGSPKTDVCSMCLRLLEQIKTEKCDIKKAQLMGQKRLHNLKANSLYSLLKDKQDNILTMSFDCQKNLPLPKIPDQSVYYSSY